MTVFDYGTSCSILNTCNITQPLIIISDSEFWVEPRIKRMCCKEHPARLSVNENAFFRSFWKFGGCNTFHHARHGNDVSECGRQYSSIRARYLFNSLSISTSLRVIAQINNAFQTSSFTKAIFDIVAIITIYKMLMGEAPKTLRVVRIGALGERRRLKELRCRCILRKGALDVLPFFLQLLLWKFTRLNFLSSNEAATTFMKTCLTFVLWTIPTKERSTGFFFFFTFPSWRQYFGSSLSTYKHGHCL